MRLNKLITGKEIWAGRSMTKRFKGADGKLSKVVRINEPHEDEYRQVGSISRPEAKSGPLEVIHNFSATAHSSTGVCPIVFEPSSRGGEKCGGAETNL